MNKEETTPEITAVQDQIGETNPENHKDNEINKQPQEIAKEKPLQDETNLENQTKENETEGKNPQGKQLPRASTFKTQASQSIIRMLEALRIKSYDLIFILCFFSSFYNFIFFWILVGFFNDSSYYGDECTSLLTWTESFLYTVLSCFFFAIFFECCLKGIGLYFVLFALTHNNNIFPLVRCCDWGHFTLCGSWKIIGGELFD